MFGAECCARRGFSGDFVALGQGLFADSTSLAGFLLLDLIRWFSYEGLHECEHYIEHGPVLTQSVPP